MPRTAAVTSVVLVALGAPGGGLSDDDDGRRLVGGPGQTARAYTSVATALAAAARAAEAGAAVGLAVGELTDDGDGAPLSGPPCDVAVALADRARLARRPGEGHIVATATLAGLASLTPPERRAGLSWVVVGPLHTGWAGVVDCVEVSRPADRPAATAIPLPAVLGLEPEFPFVGRADAWDTLAKVWQRSAEGARRVVLVGGDAGSGKSRLVTELSRWVHQRGAAVLYGQCSEQSPIPYEPFAVALDLLVAGLDAGERSRLVQGRDQELARLVPRLASGSGPPGDGPRPGSDDPGAERYRLFSAVVDTLGALAARQPVLLVLDDIHWARRPTFELLDHLVRSPGLERLCVVATFRSTPSEVGDDLKAALPDLRRQPGVSRLVISGLGRDEVRRFAELAGGHERLADLDGAVDELVHETGGNPFLLGELWHQLVEAGEAPARRPCGPARSRQPGGCARGGGGTPRPPAGRDLRPGTAGCSRRDHVPDRRLAAGCGCTVNDAVAALEPAVRARVVEESGPGEHRFVHALVRRAVVDDLPATRRRALAADVARALARLDGERSVAEVAYHLLAAVPLVGGGRGGRRRPAGGRRGPAGGRLRRRGPAARGGAAARSARPAPRRAAAGAGRRPHAGRRRGVGAGPVPAGDRAGPVDRATARSWSTPPSPSTMPTGGRPSRRRRRGPAAGCAAAGGRPGGRGPGAGRPQPGAGAVGQGRRGRGARRRDGARGPRRSACTRPSASPTRRRCSCRGRPTTSTASAAPRTSSSTLAQAEGDLEWELGAIDKLLYGTITAGDLDEARRLAARHRGAQRRGSVNRCSGSSTSRPRR